MDELKTLILDNAKSRFDRFGFQKTTMDEISRDCKISKRTLYEHFHDKQNLFDSLFVRECEKDLEIIFSRIGDVADPLDRLLSLLRTAIEYFREDIFLTRLLKNDDALFSALLTGKYHSLVTENLVAIISGIIAEGKQKQRIRPEIDEQVAAYVGLKMFQAFSYMKTIPFDSQKESQGFYTEALVDIFYHALIHHNGGEKQS
jgi:AcrR family transcriptional regulator